MKKNNNNNIRTDFIQHPYVKILFQQRYQCKYIWLYNETILTEANKGANRWKKWLRNGSKHETNHVESSDLCILKSDRQGSRLSVFHCRVGKRWGRCHKAGRSHDWCLICRRCDNYKLKWYKSMIRTRGTTPRQLKEYQDISLWGEQAWGEQATSNLLTIIHFFLE